MVNGRKPLGAKGYCINPDHKVKVRLPLGRRLRLYCDECRDKIKESKK